MNYKTIVLELIQERPALHEKLRCSGDLFSMMNQWAAELRSSHLAIMEQLLDRQKVTSREQASSEALEAAIHQIQQVMSAQEEDQAQ